MTMQSDQLNPRRKVHYSSKEFGWRRDMILRHCPNDRVGAIPFMQNEHMNAQILWCVGDNDLSEMDWPEFLKRFQSFCDQHGEVSF